MKDNKTTIILFVSLTLLLVLIVGVSFRSFKQIGMAAEARKHTFTVLSSADELYITLADASVAIY